MQAMGSACIKQICPQAVAFEEICKDTSLKQNRCPALHWHSMAIQRCAQKVTSTLKITFRLQAVWTLAWTPNIPSPTAQATPT